MAEIGEYDVIAELIPYITNTTGVGASTEYPADTNPDKWITINRSGGVAFATRCDRIILTVQAWAATSAEAYQLALTVRRAMHAAPFDHTGVSSVRELGFTQLNPNDKNKRRYQILFQLVTTI